MIYPLTYLLQCAKVDVLDYIEGQVTSVTIQTSLDHVYITLLLSNIFCVHTKGGSYMACVFSLKLFAVLT